MSLRLLVAQIDLDGLNVRRFCAEHGLSTWSFYEFRRRYAVDGEAGLEPRSRAPHQVANRTPDAVERRILDARKLLEQLGDDAGPASIHARLSRDGVSPPSVSTIWRILVREAQISRDPTKAPKHAGHRFVAERANECWQTDDTGWGLADATPVKIINILDDCSRLCVASRAAPSATGTAIFEAFTRAATESGWPERVLCDNAKAHRHPLTDALGELGVAVGHSRPYHPQTCGKVERFHLTLQQSLRAAPPPATIEELQAHLDWFRHRYNHERPHRSLGRRTPAEVWATTPKSGPASRALDTPTEVHYSTVGRNGVVSAGRRYAIHLGVDHAHQPATVIVTGLACHVFIDTRLVRQLTLDPTRRHQPLHPGPGRPAKL
jgi:transposase InsO family protein